MEQIVGYLKDPAWWFSAFFIAIIASVVAGFAKDRIERWIGSLSARNRQRLAAKAERRERVISALAEHEGYMILTMVRATGQMLFTLAMFTLFLLSPMWAELSNSWCQVVPVDPSCRVSSRTLSYFAAACFGFLSIFTGYLSSSRLRLTMLGYREYRRRRGLPRIN